MTQNRKTIPRMQLHPGGVFCVSGLFDGGRIAGKDMVGKRINDILAHGKALLKICFCTYDNTARSGAQFYSFTIARNAYKFFVKSLNITFCILFTPPKCAEKLVNSFQTAKLDLKLMKPLGFIIFR